MTPAMTSLQRVASVLSGEVPDRVPMFLSTGLHGPAMLGVSMREYFGSAELMAQSQLLKRETYRDDIVTSFAYAAAEVEAFGQETVFYENGPPNAGRRQTSRSSTCPDSRTAKRSSAVLRSLACWPPKRPMLRYWAS
jgi:uroporphyrinogen decarboxylase